MSWSQSYYIEPVNHFLTRLVGIDVGKLIAEETARRMAEQGIEVVAVEDMGRIDDMYGPDDPLMRVTLSDGRTFVHKNTRREMSDDWGSDDWELRPEDEEIVVKKKYHNPDGPDESEEP
jgi:hypothetical protein